jgi:hypothetical protein
MNNLSTLEIMMVVNLIVLNALSLYLLYLNMTRRDDFNG